MIAKDLPPFVFAHKPLEERPERMSVEDVGEPVGKRRIFQSDRAIQMCGATLTIGIDAWLTADTGPGPVQRAVDPEARFVFE